MGGWAKTVPTEQGNEQGGGGGFPIPPPPQLTHPMAATFKYIHMYLENLNHYSLGQQHQVHRYK